MEFIILFIVLIIVLRFYLNLPSTKGKLLERKIDDILKKISLEKGGFNFLDYMIPYKNQTSQIDNILMTQKAIYVIEAKNYQGFIYGSENHQSWTMTKKTTKTYKNKRGKTYQKSYINKYSFYNPIMQNQTHIRALKQNLTFDIPFISIIVFGNGATLKNVQSKDVLCIRTKDLYHSIHQVENTLDNAFTLEDQMQIVDTLYDVNIKDKKSRKSHVKSIQAKYKS